MRTSTTHPLQIAACKVGPGLGSIGITFCPGKKQPEAMTGGWGRDLRLDIAEIAAWGAAAVVTLVEPQELAALGVEDLGETILLNHMDWLHLPIPDVTAPGPSFEAAWAAAGPGLRARLRAGFNIVVHCKGGLGRAGTVAARLLVELGWEPAAGYCQTNLNVVREPLGGPSIAACERSRRKLKRERLRNKAGPLPLDMGR